MIKIKNLVFRYRNSSNNALDDLTLWIPKGKYVAILGHNGSGKSTLSKILVGLFKPTSGEVEIDGVVLNQESKNLIQSKVGIILQNPDNQFIGATVEDDIAFGLENKMLKSEKIKEIIDFYSEKVGMKEFLKREPQNLSGGQKQRVAIASVLALDPEVIIFDEVTSMLDPLGKHSILELIKDIQEKNSKTLISITHDMDEAIQADYCLVFSAGKLVASGKPADILNNKEIVELAKIDSPFIYKISQKLEGIEPTYDEEHLLEQICK
ncbi:ABC TRANSPORTER ATP-BINDING PROTEIN [Mycoplasmopsis pulmonis]|uniref:Energy-coupling factor transporter ATP-binding protein EcfA1 n=1 Tax=Mycoplasmopsis pulmonis (strain UAB CTIP) TaxID=272635 RepID=ECFA1_MYCPU|nr:energy-coupling factor transporter ATPase [Mycoplasmopsis pulmonis]Q98QH5.1 RecName: Full=Energy-coupling factor transporter ATP-binding protein EcfA1; Short=ECF transporter A component EcfA1 [Mycoplasmopsis pulmonis UAB CTIP]MDZ7293340.1 energy-coupling factor transporter ATPase [Mycoplasmopsis pulmonis]CAC13559.1 ABC TRANSPORTER ATP-BINDING PROTEIN [Mycoplasmopsis pulmonis]VEU68149.1 cobalt ABC transporter ATPase component [Mycoplasmopsis pulmonis]